VKPQEMLGKLRYYEQVTGVHGADVRGPRPPIKVGVGHCQSKYSDYATIK
jgi:hypothetical protein